MKKDRVIVIGASGAQAQAMLEAADRADIIDNWVAVDRVWRDAARARCSDLGMEIVTRDVLTDRDQLVHLAENAALVANFAGPYYRTGATVLNACIEASCDYLDICDDADATITLLDLDEDAKRAEIRALVGMGSSPGVTNVLVRAAHDYLGGCDRVVINWIVDVVDVHQAALQHFWHIFAPVGLDGSGPVPAWESLERKQVEFPAPLGEQLVINLAHAEPITMPRFLGVNDVRNYGSIVPADVLVVNWALARLGAGSEGQIQIGESTHENAEVARGLYDRFLAERESTDYLGGGLVVDVHRGSAGIRFASADSASMDESTGVPAAAGILVMLEGGPDRHGVLAPECLEPTEFFPALGRSSRGTGSLSTYELTAGDVGAKIRIRDLFAKPKKKGAVN